MPSGSCSSVCGGIGSQLLAPLVRYLVHALRRGRSSSSSTATPSSIGNRSRQDFPGDGLGTNKAEALARVSAEAGLACPGGRRLRRRRQRRAHRPRGGRRPPRGRQPPDASARRPAHRQPSGTRRSSAAATTRRTATSSSSAAATASASTATSSRSTRRSATATDGPARATGCAALAAERPQLARDEPHGRKRDAQLPLGSHASRAASPTARSTSTWSRTRRAPRRWFRVGVDAA